MYTPVKYVQDDHDVGWLLFIAPHNSTLQSGSNPKHKQHSRPPGSRPQLRRILQTQPNPTPFLFFTLSLHRHLQTSHMARSSKASDTAVVSRQSASLRASKLPAPLRFPLLVILSLSLSSLLYSFAAEYTAGELASVSRSLNEWWEVGALVGWKT